MCDSWLRGLCMSIFCLAQIIQGTVLKYKGESINNQPNLFPVEIHLFFIDVIAL